MINAVGYVRRSQEDQTREDTSINNQISAIELFCKRNGYNLLKIFNDGFISGAKGERPQFNLMVGEKLVTSGLYKYIIVRDEKRFSRSQVNAIEKLKYLKAHQIKILTIGGEDLTKDLMITGIKMAVAERQIEDGREHQRAMMERKAREGGVFGRPPTGYKPNHKILDGRLRKYGWKVDKVKSPIVKALYEDYATGEHTFQSLAYKHDMSFSTIQKILTNKNYIGVFTYNIRHRDDKQKIIATYKYQYKVKNLTPLVTEDIFEKVQQIMINKNKRPRKEVEKKDESDNRWKEETREF